MTENLEHLKIRRDKLEAKNQATYSQACERVGQRINMDTSNTRRELFHAKLVEWGVITEEQFVEYEIAFHEKVAEALEELWADLRKQAGPQLSVVQNPNKLVDGHGRPLM